MIKRILILSDTHCGHSYGLTPECFQTNDAQPYLWGWYSGKIAEIIKDHKIDHCHFNGDAIEGKGLRSGGRDIFEADRHKQIKIAEKCLEIVGADSWSFARGTPYHTGDDENFEDCLARSFDGRIFDHDWLEVSAINGKSVILDLKHHTGGSGVPHTRGTAQSREALWNLIWAEAGEQPRASFIIRSHIHYSVGSYRFVGPRQVWAITTPCLQLVGPGIGTEYGARKCSGTVDIGFMIMDVDTETGGVTWRIERALLQPMIARTLKI